MVVTTSRTAPCIAAKRGANIIPAHAKNLAGWHVAMNADGSYLLDIATVAETAGD